jgi:hypothetical protein
LSITKTGRPVGVSDGNPRGKAALVRLRASKYDHDTPDAPATGKAPQTKTRKIVRPAATKGGDIEVAVSVRIKRPR